MEGFLDLQSFSSEWLSILSSPGGFFTDGPRLDDSKVWG